jgi:hypothetical protein
MQARSPGRLAALIVSLCGTCWAHVAPAAASAPAVPCATLASVAIPFVQILSATYNAAAGGFPGFCNVVGVINKRISSQDPEHFTYGVGFEVNLPDEWSGNFEMMGGGGTDGTLLSPVGFFGTELAQGWVVATEDGGHENAPVAGIFGPYTPPPGVTWSDEDGNAGGSAHFGVDAQARADYGFNGILGTTITSKALIQYYYGSAPGHSYICGCSNGGRDAMIASQRFPQLFDGVVAGNPGFNLPQAAIAEAWNEQALAPLATSIDVNGQPYLPPTFTNADLEVASAAILSACDALDGLVDGIIDNFQACTTQKVVPALQLFTCSATGAYGNVPHAGSCLTAGQVAALQKIFAGPTDSAGRALYSNWYWDAGIWDPPSANIVLGWQAWNVSFLGPPGFNSAFNLTLGAGALPMIFTTPPVVTPVNGPTAQEAFMFGYNFDTDAPKIFARTKAYPLSAMDFMAATSTNLSAFQSHGSKLIIYNSVNDGVFSGASIVKWYEQLLRSNSAAPTFARLFMVPNMAHCGGGPATSSFAANTLQAITSWVETGRPPQRIVATNTDTVAPFPNNGLFDPQVSQNFPAGGTRPLCPYPLQSRYKGSGATDDANSFACVSPH